MKTVENEGGWPTTCLNYRAFELNGGEQQMVSTAIRFDNAHTIKGHSKRDHKHLFNNEVQEIEFNNPKELIDELMKLIEDNRCAINEIKGP
ncbi:MAG: DUF6516 family protein [Methanosarcinales archaeon]|nr:DUF6516 family protein [Methanosarcinales archaeon]